jgi:tetratricopeptide (TPR) repeat protein
VLRLALFAVLTASLLAPGQEAAQKPAQQSGEQAPAAATSAAPQAASQQVAEAEAAIGKSDWKSAQTRLDLYLKDNPADTRALFDAGYVADAQDRLADAESLYRRAIDADPNSFEAHLSLGLLLARQGNTDDARPELDAATRLDPGDAGPALKARAWRALARIDKEDDPTEASSDLLEALKLTPETTADTLLAASIADQAGEFDAEAAAYRRVLASDPNSRDATTGLAHALIALKQYPEAETLLRPAVEKSPDDTTLNAQLATVLAAEDKAEAIPLLQKLHAAHPKDHAITRMLASVLAQAANYAASDQLYVTLLADAPNDSAVLVALGQNHIRQHRYADAYADFNKAAQLDPASGEAWSGLAFAASKIGHPDVTLHALTMRSKYLPEVPSTYFLWATAYDSLHQRGQAVSYYNQFLASAAGKFPDQEWQAHQRLKLLSQKP